jgi:hypothetical protein
MVRTVHSLHALEQRPNHERFPRPNSPFGPHKIWHPSIQPPLNAAALREAKEGVAKFYPKNWRYQQELEKLRSGLHLGEDYPYNLLSNRMWSKRRYNTTFENQPLDMSTMDGVFFRPSENIWTVKWIESTVTRWKWFKVQSQGFQRAKYAAEAYRRKLEAAGRVDNVRTERQLWLHYLAEKAKYELKGNIKGKRA